MRRIIQTIRQILMIPALLSIYLALAIIEHRERRRGAEMRKSTEHDIIRWHERGYTVAEIRRIMPQCTTDEITAVINNHPTENGARRR